MKKIYLAIPYSGFKEESYLLANEITIKLMLQGNVVFSPITHNHILAKSGELPTGWEYWKEIDTPFVQWCDELFVIIFTEDGINRIKKSIGVQAEIILAKQLNKKITFLKQNEL